MSDVPAPMICEKCHVGTMRPTRIPKFSQALVVFGYLLIVGSLIVMLGAGGCALISTGITVTTSQAEQAAGRLTPHSAEARFAGSLAFGVVGLIMAGIIAVPLFILGLVFVMKKNVWQCSRCQFVFDRA